MAWGFRKSMSLGGGIRLNVGKRGLGVSAGIPGFRVGVNSRGTYVSNSIPGTGLHSTQYLGHATTSASSSSGQFVSTTIQNEYLGISKSLKASSQAELQMKIANQMEMWAKQEEKLRAREAIADLKAKAEYDTKQAELIIGQYYDLLKTTLSIDDRLSWETLKKLGKYQGFKFNETLPVFDFTEEMPVADNVKKLLGVPKQSWLEIIPSIKQKRLLAEAKAEEVFQDRLLAYNSKKQEAQKNHDSLVKNYENRKAMAFEEYEQDKIAFEKAQTEFNQGIDKFKNDFEHAVPEAVMNYVRVVLEKSIYPEGISKEFEVGYESDTVIIDYLLPHADDLPCIVGYKYVSTRKEIDAVEMKKKEFQDFYQKVIAQIVIRTIHEVFESVYVKEVSKVVFNGWVEGLDSKTGNDVSVCIVSCIVSRDVFEGLNLERIDVEECLKYLNPKVGGAFIKMKSVDPMMAIERSENQSE